MKKYLLLLIVLNGLVGFSLASEGRHNRSVKLFQEFSEEEEEEEENVDFFQGLSSQVLRTMEDSDLILEDPSDGEEEESFRDLWAMEDPVPCLEGLGDNLRASEDLFTSFIENVNSDENLKRDVYGTIQSYIEPINERVIQLRVRLEEEIIPQVEGLIQRGENLEGIDFGEKVDDAFMQEGIEILLFLEACREDLDNDLYKDIKLGLHIEINTTIRIKSLLNL
ncbi:MAG: hypothetical protein LBN94_01015 [Puniceicoccales bacterium]|nr:hypothetical protein [Puniceicoccales bacterium]